MFKSIQKFLLVLALAVPALSQAVPSVARLPVSVTATAYSDIAMDALAPSDPAPSCRSAQAATHPAVKSLVFVQGDRSPMIAMQGAGCHYICQACSQFGWPDACARCATCGGAN
jgi:hypothetical protein